MHSNVSITFLANAGYYVFSDVVKSGWMRIEIDFSRIKYETSLLLVNPRHRIHIASIAIERLGVINCTRTFFFSRQVHQPTVGACNPVASVNEFCEKRRHY